MTPERAPSCYSPEPAGGCSRRHSARCFPQVAAQVFVVPTARERADGLAPGNYWMQVRFIVRDTTPLAQSVPLFVQVR